MAKCKAIACRCTFLQSSCNHNCSVSKQILLWCKVNYCYWSTTTSVVEDSNFYCTAKWELRLQCEVATTELQNALSAERLAGEMEEKRAFSATTSNKSRLQARKSFDQASPYMAQLIFCHIAVLLLFRFTVLLLTFCPYCMKLVELPNCTDAAVILQHEMKILDG